MPRLGVIHCSPSRSPAFRRWVRTFALVPARMRGEGLRDTALTGVDPRRPVLPHQSSGETRAGRNMRPPPIRRAAAPSDLPAGRVRQSPSPPCRGSDSLATVVLLVRTGSEVALTSVAARPREREPGALAGRRGSGRRQAHRRLRQSRRRRAAGVADHHAGPSRAWRCVPLAIRRTWLLRVWRPAFMFWRARRTTARSVRRRPQERSCCCTRAAQEEKPRSRRERRRLPVNAFSSGILGDPFAVGVLPCIDRFTTSVPIFASLSRRRR